MSNSNSPRGFWDTKYQNDNEIISCIKGQSNLVLNNALTHFGDINGKRIIDLGFGNGLASIYFASKGATVISVDYSEVALDKLSRFCRENAIDNIHPVCISALDLDQLEPVDFIFGSLILHHIEPFDQFSSILRKTIKNGGKGYFWENNSRSNILIWFRNNLVGKLWIPKRGDEDEFPLMPQEIELLRNHFDVQVNYPYMHFFRMASNYIFRGKLRNPLVRVDNFLFNFKRFRKYSYRQEIYLS